MNRKKLPRVIRRTSDIRQAVAGQGARERPEASWRSTDSPEPGNGGAAAPQPDRSGDIVAATAQLPASSVARTMAAAVELDATRRRLRARAIVERHATYSAVGGIIPLPIANVASITAIIVRMVKMLSDLYGVPFERDRARSIVMGLVGGTLPTGLAAVTSSTLYYVVPASALIGLAVSSVAAVGCTRSIGRIFVEHFESGATLRDFSAVERNDRGESK
jgi:uncharacterized protein (DUF697 family)